jgi:tetratricopeptide (TPR) repeat protein
LIRHDVNVGRDQELAKSLAVWEQSKTGAAAMLMIGGEPGIGKTHLARRFIDHIAAQDKALILTGDCYPNGGRPYAPVAQVIEAWFCRPEGETAAPTLAEDVIADLRQIAPELRTRFPSVKPNPRLAPLAEQQRIFDSFVTFLRWLSQTRSQPVMLVFEDMHWADADSLQILRYAIRRGRTVGLPLLAVLTFRDTETSLPSSQILREIAGDLALLPPSKLIELPRLERKQTHALVGKLLQDQAGIAAKPVPSAFSDAIYEQTEGNPFFVEELCRLLFEEDRLPDSGSPLAWIDGMYFRIPSTIRELILSRVRRLSTPCQQMLQAAAFLGRDFDLKTLIGLTGIEEETLILLLEASIHARLIIERPSVYAPMLSFAHQLIPYTLRESLSELRRRRFHQHVANFLEVNQPENFTLLAYHFAAAADQMKAVQFAHAAARQAMKVFAFETALQHLSGATDRLESMRPIALHLSILEDLGDVHRLMGNYSEAVTTYQEALAIWQQLPERDRWAAVRLHRKIGETVTSTNQYAELHRLNPAAKTSLATGLLIVMKQPPPSKTAPFHTLEPAAETGPSETGPSPAPGLSIELEPHPETVRLLAALARNNWYMQPEINWELSQQYVRKAVEMAEFLNSPVELSAALESLVNVYGIKGMLRERVDVCLRRLALSYHESFDDLRERSNILLQAGMALYDVGDYTESIEYLTEAEKLAKQIRDIPAQADALVRLGQCLFRLDRWDELIEIEPKMRQLEELFTVKRMGVLICFYYALLSSVGFRRGDAQTGQGLKSEAYNVMVSIGGPQEGWVRNQHF